MWIFIQNVIEKASYFSHFQSHICHAVSEVHIAKVSGRACRGREKLRDDSRQIRMGSGLFSALYEVVNVFGDSPVYVCVCVWRQDTPFCGRRLDRRLSTNINIVRWCTPWEVFGKIFITSSVSPSLYSGLDCYLTIFLVLNCFTVPGFT